MPGIWNVNNGYNINSKKISSKLTFEVGEKFTGRVVSKGEGKDVTIKLADGWQFIAEVDGKVNFEDLKLVKFEVEGSQNGKLMLKIVNGEKKENSEVDDNFQEIIEKEGLSKEDVSILKKMVAHNIPLTRKNINEIKSILQFNEKLNLDEKEANSFIEKYISSKGISSDSAEAQVIKDTLTKFFNEFKNMSSDDLMLFIENNIEFSAENIESYNKLFKGDSSIEKILANIKDQLQDVNFDELLKNNNTVSEFEKLSTNNEYNKSEMQNTALASKVYAENDPSNTKVDVLNILKTLASKGDNDEVNISKDIQAKTIVNPEKELESLDKSIANHLKNKDVVKVIKDAIGNQSIFEKSDSSSFNNQAAKLIESTNKAKVEEILSKLENKEVRLTSDEFKKISEFVNKESEIEQSVVQESLNDTKVLNEVKDSKFVSKNIFVELENVMRNDIDDNTMIRTQIKSEIDKARDVVKGLLSQTDLNSAVQEKVLNAVKENINDFKVFNSISNEYYYLNFNILAAKQDYPCKLIIKDNRKDGKKLDSTNAKMVVSVKTVNLGEIDGYLSLKDKRIDVNLKCDDKVSMVLKTHKNELISGLQTLGLFVNVTVSVKEQPVDIANCRSFFNDMTISTIDTKV